MKIQNGRLNNKFGAHQHAAKDVEIDEQNQGLGRSKGGFLSKLLVIPSLRLPAKDQTM